MDGETAEVTVMGELVMAIGFPEWVGLDGCEPSVITASCR